MEILQKLIPVCIYCTSLLVRHNQQLRLLLNNLIANIYPLPFYHCLQSPENESFLKAETEAPNVPAFRRYWDIQRVFLYRRNVHPSIFGETKALSLMRKRPVSTFCFSAGKDFLWCSNKNTAVHWLYILPPSV
ncbi:hypothetical protein XENTR_v10018544 [Xenopus tropicalis]|nr:hypothetical protein XENTR_v10018544 [Xenopus tropicalis]